MQEIRTLTEHYTINDTCDWCVESKACRYLCDRYGVPLLAICQDCDETGGE